MNYIEIYFESGLKFLLSLLIFLPSCSLAMSGGSHIVGNGGDVLVCLKMTDGQGPRVQLLDHYEIKTFAKLPLDLSPEASVEELVNQLLNRLGTFNQGFANTLQAFNTEFDDEVLFLTNVELSEVDDSLHVSIPIGCELRQIAIQVEPRLPGFHRYIINKDLWDQLSNVDKAGLRLHELLYRVLIENHTYARTLDSRDIRLLTGLASANMIKRTFNPVSFHAFLTTKLNYPCSSPVFESTGFVCIDTNALDDQKVLFDYTWETLFQISESGDLMKSRIKFHKGGQMDHEDICLLSQRYQDHQDISVFLTVPFEVKGRKLVILESASQTERNYEERTFCQSNVHAGEFEFRLLPSGKLWLFGLEFQKVHGSVPQDIESFSP